VKSILESIPVYCLSVAKTLISILNNFMKCMMHFLWSCNANKDKYHLSRWEKISLPKKLGGWSIKNLSLFNLALSLKIPWRGLFGSRLWSGVLKYKYLQKKYFEDWIKMPNKSILNTSNFWHDFVKSYPWMGSWLSWRIGNGKKIQLGIDPFIGGEEFYKLSNPLIY